MPNSETSKPGLLSRLKLVAKRRILVRQFIHCKAESYRKIIQHIPPPSKPIKQRYLMSYGWIDHKEQLESQVFAQVKSLFYFFGLILSGLICLPSPLSRFNSILCNFLVFGIQIHLLRERVHCPQQEIHSLQSSFLVATAQLPACRVPLLF